MFFNNGIRVVVRLLWCNDDASTSSSSSSLSLFSLMMMMPSSVSSSSSASVGDGVSSSVSDAVFRNFYTLKKKNNKQDYLPHFNGLYHLLFAFNPNLNVFFYAVCVKKRNKKHHRPVLVCSKNMVFCDRRSIDSMTEQGDDKNDSR